MSLRTRLVLGLLVLAALGLVAADIATYTSLRSFLFDRTEATLDTDHRVVEATLLQRRGLSPDDFQALTAAAPGVYIQLRNPQTNQILYSGEVPQFSTTSAPPPPRLPARITAPQSSPGSPDRVSYFTASATKGSTRYRARASLDPGSGVLLIVATTLSDVDSTLHRLLLIELLVTGIVLLAMVLLGLWVVRLSLRPLDDIGKTATAIAAGDLTQRVERAEERTEVGRLGLALNTMLGQIEASDLRLRRFVADASHELRTPLSAVRAYAELFKRGADRRPEDLARAMAGIGRESERMSMLIDDLLLLARLDEGRPLEREPVRLDEVAAEAVETARALEPDRPIELHAEQTSVLGDHDRLRQIFDNLLGNVRSHTPAGGPARVTVTGMNGSAVIAVEDSGPGLPPEEAEHVFERFYRADASRSRESGGVGLGLSIVAAIAEAHDGSASATSEPGQGSAFRVTLPLLEAGESEGDA